MLPENQRTPFYIYDVIRSISSIPLCLFSTLTRALAAGAAQSAASLFERPLLCYEYSNDPPPWHFYKDTSAWIQKKAEIEIKRVHWKVPGFKSVLFLKKTSRLLLGELARWYSAPSRKICALQRDASGKGGMHHWIIPCFPRWVLQLFEQSRLIFVERNKLTYVYLTYLKVLSDASLLYCIWRELERIQKFHQKHNGRCIYCIFSQACLQIRMRRWVFLANVEEKRFKPYLKVAQELGPWVQSV